MIPTLTGNPNASFREIVDFYGRIGDYSDTERNRRTEGKEKQERNRSEALLQLGTLGNNAEQGMYGISQSIADPVSGGKICGLYLSEPLGQRFRILDPWSAEFLNLMTTRFQQYTASVGADWTKKLKWWNLPCQNVEPAAKNWRMGSVWCVVICHRPVTGS